MVDCNVTYEDIEKQNSFIRKKRAEAGEVKDGLRKRMLYFSLLSCIFFVLSFIYYGFVFALFFALCGIIYFARKHSRFPEEARTDEVARIRCLYEIIVMAYANAKRLNVSKYDCAQVARYMCYDKIDGISSDADYAHRMVKGIIMMHGTEKMPRGFFTPDHLMY